MQQRFDLGQTPHQACIAEYLHLTRRVMPDLATSTRRDWPIRQDHCFQRVVLDAVFDGVWYDHVARPAYRHLSETKALQAVQLCRRIIEGQADLDALNRQSLRWRGTRAAARAG